MREMRTRQYASFCFLSCVSAFVQGTARLRRHGQKRVYAFALSQDGLGTWNITQLRTQLFAALLTPGGVDPVEMSRLLNVAVWAFYGYDDRVTPVSYFSHSVASIRQQCICECFAGSGSAREEPGDLPTDLSAMYAQHASYVDPRDRALSKSTWRSLADDTGLGNDARMRI
jgi:hypothetical protein